MRDTVPSTAMPVSRLIEELGKLPGIGPKSAQRLTYYLLRASAEDAQAATPRGAAGASGGHLVQAAREMGARLVSDGE